MRMSRVRKVLGQVIDDEFQGKMVVDGWSPVLHTPRACKDDGTTFQGKQRPRKLGEIDREAYTTYTTRSKPYPGET